MKYISKIISSIKEEYISAALGVATLFSCSCVFYQITQDRTRDYEFSRSQAERLADKDQSGILDQSEMLAFARDLKAVRAYEAVTPYELESRIQNAPKEDFDMYRHEWFKETLKCIENNCLDVQIILDGLKKM